MASDPAVVLLIGADIGLLDESQYARTLTAIGNAARTTAQVKYGAGSLTFDGSGDGISAADSADFTFGSGNFTIELFVRFVSRVAQDIIGQWETNGASLALSSWFIFNSGTTLTFRGCNGAAFTDATGTWSATLGQWYHLAVDRSGNTVRLYIDGVVIGTNSAFSIALNDSPSLFTLGMIGSGNPFPTSNFSGQMDEVRISKGIARYAGAFTPPTGPFPRPDAAAARVTQAAVEVLGTALAVVTTAARVTQAAVELVSRPTPALRATQAAIEVLHRLGRWKLTIDGVDRTTIVEAVSITWTLNERARATVVVADELPDRYAELVVYAPDGVTPLFGGLILQRNFQGRTQAHATFTASLECGDFFTYADWVFTTSGFADGVTLGAVLAYLVTTHLAQYGITLDPAQVAGPALAGFNWENKRVSDALRELSDRTGYVVRISAAKVLRMLLPMTVGAPFSLTEAATNCEDVTWRDSDRTPYNTVVLRCGPDGLSAVDEEKHYGDGVRRRWKLYAPFSQIIGGLITGSDATGNDPGGYNVGIFGEDDIPWTVDLATNEVVQRADQPVRAVGDYFLIWYTAAFPFTVRVTTGATPAVEYAESRPDVRSEPVALEIASGLLASFQAAPRELHIETNVDGLDPGQALTVDLPTIRSIAGLFLVTSVALRIAFDIDGGARLWQYQVEAVESDLYQGSWLDGWRKMAGIGGGSSGSVTGGGGTVNPILSASSLLGRGASSAGAVEEITLSNSLIMTGTTLTVRTGIFDYAFNDAVIEPPSAGQIRLNAAFPWTTVSKAWVRFVSSDDQDLYWGIMIIPTGATLIVQDKDDHTRYGRFVTTGVPIDKGLYAEVPIAYVAHGTVITTAQRVFLRAVAT